jgi:hypothetical protein
VQELWAAALIVDDHFWGEFEDPKQMAASLEAALTLLAELQARVADLEAAIQSYSFMQPAQSSYFTPRNWRNNV